MRVHQAAVSASIVMADLGGSTPEPRALPGPEPSAPESDLPESVVAIPDALSQDATGQAQPEVEANADGTGNEYVGPQFKPMSKKRRALKSIFTFYGVLLVVMPILFMVVLAFLFRAPLHIFILGCVVFIPATIFFFLIKHLARGESLPTSFLMDQIFIGAVPGLTISTAFIFLFLACLSRFVFSKSIFEQITTLFRQLAMLSVVNAKDKLMFYQRYKNTDAFYIVTIGPVVIAGVSAVVKEFAKLAVAFRCEQLLHYGPALGPRGALATAAGAGLGFATMEIAVFSSIFVAEGVSVGSVGLILLASIWLLPLHVGTAFYMGVAIAKKKILHVRASVFGAYLVSVIFNFLITSINLYMIGLIFFRAYFSKGFSWWIYAGGLIAKVVIVIILGILCKKSYNNMDLARYSLPAFEIEEPEAGVDVV